VADIKIKTTPAPEDLRYFREKKLKPSFSYKDVWGEEHANAFTVAKSAGFDVLADVRAAVDAAIADGETFESFKAKLEPTLRAKGWWGRKVVIDPKTQEKIVAQLGSPRRLKVIYESNLRAARAAGQWERAQRTKRGLPYFLYGLGPSENHRPHHESKKGLVLPVDHPFWDAWYPPNGWGCKCWLRQITRREAERLGGVSGDPDVENYEFFNGRRGTTEHIPVGIDPGWHTSPGKGRARFLAKELGERVAALPVAEQHQHVVRLVKGPIFGEIVEGRMTGVLPVAILTARRQAQLAGKSPVVLLSSSTAHKQKRSQGRLTAADYAVVDEILREGTAFSDAAHRLTVYGMALGRWWRVTVKRTVDGGENFLTSLFKMETAEALKQMRRRQVSRLDE
jgi:hypothetical protein